MIAQAAPAFHALDRGTLPVMGMTMARDCVETPFECRTRATARHRPIRHEIPGRWAA